MNIIEKIKEYKIIPVVAIGDVKSALPLGNALIDSGLPIIEITFRSNVAVEVMSILKKELPEILLSAGTVLTIDQLKSAIKAGAEFIVAPGFNPTIVDYCVKNEITIIPGVNSPSLIEWGLERGLNVFKFFPINSSGGTTMLKSLYGPYPGVNFIPVGGINNNNLIEYLKLSNVIACGGSWIVHKDLIASKNFEEISKLAKEAVAVIKKEIK